MQSKGMEAGVSSNDTLHQVAKLNRAHRALSLLIYSWTSARLKEAPLLTFEAHLLYGKTSSRGDIQNLRV